MAEGLFENVYNPDVLSCLANLSNDEVFTPPDVVNEMLDMLPQELFSDPDTTFLDPACKTGVFLREIAKRFITGLEPQFPDLQERIDHIFHKQLFGIAITELTSLLSRRGLYCSKYPNSNYSVSRFDDAQGNIRFKRISHKWEKGKCVYCGASESQYERGDELETHAYEWIHTIKPEEIFKMKFDVIISNPPYQLSTGGSKAQAIPLYDKFVMQAKKLKPRYMTMIIPARWYAGGMGLDSFREKMLNDNSIRKVVDYPNSKDCFPGVSIGGGVCYFLWDRDNKGECEFTNIHNNNISKMNREMSEFPVFVRYNEAISIIRKVQSITKSYLSDKVSSISPFGISTKINGNDKKKVESDVCLISSKGRGYIPIYEIQKGNDLLPKYKVFLSQTSAEHAGEASSDGMFRVLTTSMTVGYPQEACTHSYLVLNPTESQNEAENLLTYLKTKFLRFLVLQSLSSIHITKSTFCFVPMQDFSKPWTDEELYAKYGLTQEEIDFIESMIKPMELGGE